MWLNKNGWNLLPNALTGWWTGCCCCGLWQLQSPFPGRQERVSFVLLVSCFLLVFGRFQVSSSSKVKTTVNYPFENNLKLISLLNFNLRRTLLIALERTGYCHITTVSSFVQDAKCGDASTTAFSSLTPLICKCPRRVSSTVIYPCSCSRLQVDFN